MLRRVGANCLDNASLMRIFAPLPWLADHLPAMYELNESNESTTETLPLCKDPYDFS